MSANVSARVRAARREDVPMMWELVLELAHYERLQAIVHNDPGRLAAQLFDPGAWPKVEALVAEVDGTIAGYALFYGCYSSFRGQPVIWLEDLCVTAARRASGAGFALMRALARIAVERDCARVAWDVLDWNEPSIAFYERLGAKRNQGWHGYSLAGGPLEDLGRSE
jgi:GNAT superfamily N-acetyltransferase